ncbi:ADP-heptose:LPS heptosyltransferase [Dysgonomonas alginatilytica]|uniref:ADP-heptose:LPS heptosyltransferase n=1 Tax=Dysgonomonas alginatilytica TaxID=1605892 RepID=A0A2V3PPN8_9BACT|nr:glycosyltransferase family 9 protein [Dysgonomonas alginatilytica]PXV62843.1 ADP-heptose:LPS heptosyltransferase [Dysgonomonas alginatilytica]
MARVLITRISSFGDVAMLVPVVFSVAARYPQDRFVVLTRKAFAPLFENLGFNINAVTIDVKKQHKGFWGIFRLLRSVTRYKYTHVADVHDVLRTKIIRFYMSVLGKHVAHIDKGRAEKRQMIESKKVNPPLMPTIERYMEVFEDLGFPAEMVFTNYFELKERSLYPLRTIVKEKKGRWIGVAPFSKHAEKVYPLDKMENVVAKLSQQLDTTLFLFGSGPEERALMEKWADTYSNIITVSGKLNLENEILLMSYLDIMISMDSANMHLASLVEVPVVSIWGATHPNLGFYGFGQDPDNAIQADIECNPCSVFGEIPCYRKDIACLNSITEEMILKKVDRVLYKKKHIDQTDEVEQ